MSTRYESCDASLPPTWLELLFAGREQVAGRPLDDELQHANAVVQSLLDSLPLNLLFKDHEGRRVFANRSYLNFLDWELEDVLGKTDFDLFPSEIARGLSGEDAEVLHTGREIRGTSEHRTLGGFSRWVERVKGPLRDTDGKIVGVQVVIWDATDRRKAEEALDLERDLLHSLMDNIPDSIYFKDRSSRFLRISRATLDKFGLATPDEVIGKTDADIFTAEHAQEALADEQEIMRTGVPVVARLERETWPDRDDTWVSTTKMPLRNSDGRIGGTFGITRDVTELKQTQDKLLVARDEADAASQAKSDFLANVSHEIRTPMNGIMGMTDLLLNTELTDEQRQCQNIVKESAEALLSLLNSILDFSKIEAGKLELEHIVFPLRATLGSTLQTLAARASQKGIELAVRIPSKVPENLCGDPVRLRQILVNLVGNAIKFTDAGEVVVEVDVESLEETVAELHFSVRDTGTGVPVELQEKIFAAFSQADASTTRKHGGTGLGLAISSQLVRMMGGEIWVESEVGAGSNFHFTVRFGRAAGEWPPQPADLESLHELPVLVIDDNQTNRIICEELLTEWGMKPTSAGSGPAGLQQLRLADEAGRPFRLLLLDVMMPEMDGFDVVDQLRSDRRQDDLVIIMLSSAGRSEDITRRRELGISRCMSKPFTQSDLCNAITSAFGTAYAIDESVEVPLAEQPTDFVARHVLLAEDGVVNQKVAVSLLEKRGHHVAVANNGAEAVQKYAADRFDLILMDVQMPIMDGFEATAAIRASEQGTGCRTPIVAITAHAMKGDRESCLDAGMDDYVSKPFRPEELYRVVEQLAVTHDNATLAENRPSAEVLSWRTARPPAAKSENDAVDRSDTPPYDREIAMRSVDGSEELLSEMAGLFLQEYPGQMEQISRARADNDLIALSRAAHTMKGSASLFGAKSVQQAASRLERIGAEGDLSNYEGAWRDLQAEMSRLSGALEQLCR